VLLESSLGCCFGDIYVGGASDIIVDDDTTTTHDMQMKKDNTLLSQEARDVAGTTLFK
jgi:hypothetical protein